MGGHNLCHPVMDGCALPDGMPAKEQQRSGKDGKQNNPGRKSRDGASCAVFMGNPLCGGRYSSRQHSFFSAPSR